MRLIQWRIQDFPGEGRDLGYQPQKLGAPTHSLAKHFPESCMKMKEFGPKGASKSSGARIPSVNCKLSWLIQRIFK